VGRARGAVCLCVGALSLIGAPAAAPDTPAPAKAVLYDRGASEDDECGTIWSIDPTTGETDPVIDRGHGDCDPDWAPDGQRFAFASDRGFGTAIYIADSTGSNIVQVTHPRLGAKDYMPAWSPNGKRIAFERYVPAREAYDLYVVNSDGSNLRQLATGHGFDGTPSWSPDGRILFVSDRPHGAEKLCESCGALFVLRIGGTAKRLTARRFNALMPAWSPNGKYIAWVRSRSINETGSLYAMHANGTAARRIDVDGGSPAWSPDSRTIVYSGDDGLRLVRLDGHGRRVLTHDGGFGPSWRPTAGP
jgi:Tol biopolymer transport system component